MIKFHLIKLEKALVFQIVQQDESFRGMEDFKASNGIGIRSVSSSGISWAFNMVFINGYDNERDGRADVINFHSNAARDAYHDRVLQAFKELAESRKPQTQESKEGVYEF